MLLVSECVARAALERQESRGGHTRDDFPKMSPTGGRSTSSARSTATASRSSTSRCPTMPIELLGLFDLRRAGQVHDAEELTELPDPEGTP